MGRGAVLRELLLIIPRPLRLWGVFDTMNS